MVDLSDSNRHAILDRMAAEFDFLFHCPEAKLLPTVHDDEVPTVISNTYYMPHALAWIGLQPLCSNQSPTCLAFFANSSLFRFVKCLNDGLSFKR